MPMRAQILDAAEKVLADKGPSGFTLIAVCRAAGLSHTSIYKHFESRDHIVAALAGRWLDGIMRDLEALPDAGGKREAQLHRVLLALLRHKRSFAAQSAHLHAAYSLALEGNLDLKFGWTGRLRGLIAKVLGIEDLPDHAPMLDGIMAATMIFRHPSFVGDQTNGNLEGQLAAVMLLMADHLAAEPRSHMKNT
jgi:AcrR family transcriptional regulator